MASDAREPRELATVEITLRVDQGFLLGGLIDGWTEGEREALRRGEQEALDALKTEATFRALAAPHDVAVESFEIDWGALNG